MICLPRCSTEWVAVCRTAILVVDWRRAPATECRPLVIAGLPSLHLSMSGIKSRPTLICNTAVNFAALRGPMRRIGQPRSVSGAAQLQEDKDFHYWDVDFHSIYWRADSHGIAIERVPVPLEPALCLCLSPPAMYHVYKIWGRGNDI